LGRTFCFFLSGVLIVLLLQGCAGGGYRYTDHKPAPQPDINDVKDQIRKTKQQIKDYEKFRTEQLHIAVINDVQNDKSRGWTKGDGKPSYEDLASTAYGNVAATEKEITKLKKKLKTLEEQKKSIMKQSSGCFLAETLIKMEDGSLKSFADIKPGQKVLTYDIGYGKLVNKKVVEVYSVKANHLYTINGQLNTTGGERLLSQDGWKKISNIKKGDFVHLDGKMVEVENIEYKLAEKTLYNIQVADTHNFYVITTNGSGYLVHNTSGSPGGSSGGGKK
jgi:Pretoxin HINT domain